jgi:hypothetical protein
MSHIVDDRAPKRSERLALIYIALLFSGWSAAMQQFGAGDIVRRGALTYGAVQR